MIPALLITCAYFLGSIPTGVLVARSRGVDIRAVGSGNIGATNVGRALGKPWALVVLVLDAGKGFLPVFVGRRLGVADPLVAAAGLGAIAGHMTSVFLRGRGGKGVATALGVSLAISIPAGLCGLGLYALAYALFRISSVGSLLGVWSFPVWAWLWGGVPAPYLVLSVVTASLVTLRHRENIRRLRRGEEKRS